MYGARGVEFKTSCLPTVRHWRDRPWHVYGLIESIDDSTAEYEGAARRFGSIEQHSEQRF